MEQRILHKTAARDINIYLQDKATSKSRIEVIFASHAFSPLLCFCHVLHFLAALVVIPLGVYHIQWVGDAVANVRTTKQEP